MITFDYDCHLGHYLLMLSDTGERDPEHGKMRIRYALVRLGEEQAIFDGDDFLAPIVKLEELPDYAASELLGFLTLMDGDVEDDWFASYTPRQREFAENEAEELKIWQIDLEGRATQHFLDLQRRRA